MKIEEIKNIILQSISLEELHILLHENHYQIIAVDHMFIAMNTLEAHKFLYAPLIKYILNNKIHSISIKVFSPKEWSIKRKLFNL